MSEELQHQITMNINEAATMVGVSAATIRNWEKAGLITPQRKKNGYRIYTMTDIEQLKEIRTLSIDKKISMSAIYSMLDKKYGPGATIKEQPVSKKMLGQKWKNYRLKRGISVAQVAKAVNVSPSYLSKIESAQANVSFEILERLAKFYGENILYYFEQKDVVAPISSTGKTEKFTIGLEGVTLTARSTLRNANLKVMTYTIEPLCGRMEGNTHHGEEFIYILEGSLIFTLGEEEFHLAVGDSMHYDSMTLHRWRNPSKEQTAKMLWAYTGGEA